MPDLATALKNAINNINTNKEIKVKDEAQITHNIVNATDISNIVNEWAEDKQADAGPHKEKKYGFKVTNNVSRATFDCVKANPGKKQAVIATMMEQQGYKRSSVCTLMVQMVKVGIMRRSDDGLYYINAPEYAPISLSKLKEVRRAEEKQRKKLMALAKAALKNPSVDVKQAATRVYNKTGKYAKKQDAGIAALGAQAGGVIMAGQNQIQAATQSGAQQISHTFDADQLLSTLSFNQAIALYKKLKTMLGEV